MMRKLVIVGLFVLTGCQSVAGPFQPRPLMRVDDPRYSIAEQQSRFRDRIGMPDDYSGMPKTGAALPGSGFGNR